MTRDSKIVFSDWLFDLRTWLRTHPALVPLVNGRVFFRVPPVLKGQKFPAIAPFMRVYSAGGGPQPGEAPIEDNRAAIEVWGNEGSDYDNLREVVVALKSAFFRMDNDVVGGTCFFYGLVTSAPDAPDPSTGAPRYVVDTLITCRAMEAT